MLYSKLFSKTNKSQKELDSVNATLLHKAGFIDQVASGIYSFLPLGLRVLRKIENIIREEMDAIGGQEILMPALQPKENWLETNRWNIEILFKLEGANGKEMALGPTHEEIVTPLLKQHVFSYRDLPQAVYQIQTKFRNELRAKSGLLRGREFLMKDMYSFHIDTADLDRFYEQAKVAYERIYERVGLGDRTVLTFASGGDFTDYSHEFQTLTEVGEDTIYLCERCQVAINQEIIKEQKKCTECGNEQLVEKKAVEVGNIFKLGPKYAKAFGFSCKNEQGEEHPVEMGCYGIGLPRLMGTVVEVFHDERGLIWPEEIAPFRYHLVAGSEPEVMAKAKEVYDRLVKDGQEVLFDDREGVSMGEKLAEADLIGIPDRLVVSQKTIAQDSLELKKRNAQEAKLLPLDTKELS